jgi:hypothetical protein
MRPANVDAQAAAMGSNAAYREPVAAPAPPVVDDDDETFDNFQGMLRLRYVASATYERLICLDSALANLFLLN